MKGIHPNSITIIIYHSNRRIKYHRIISINRGFLKVYETRKRASSSY
jgi:hypothetical protein